MKLPKFLIAELATPPLAGDGVHSWIFRVSRHLHAHMEEDDIFRLLKGKVEDCGREVSDRELRDAVRNSKECAWGATGKMCRRDNRKWPNPNPARIQKVLEAHDLDVDELEARSPHSVNQNGKRLSTSELLSHLFPEDALICAGRTDFQFDTCKAQAWRKRRLDSFEKIVPSPMSKVEGRRKSDGELSKHTLDNTGPRRFLVIEFDQGTLDEQSSLIWELGTRAPLVMVVFSGSKSLHAWFYCEGEDEEDLRRYMEFAVTLGADSATWTRSQFVRMPNAMRDGEDLQKVVFFNPKLIRS